MRPQLNLLDTVRRVESRLVLDRAQHVDAKQPAQHAAFRHGLGLVGRENAEEDTPRIKQPGVTARSCDAVSELLASHHGR